MRFASIIDRKTGSVNDVLGMKNERSEFHCQSFRQGCCGCCVNMRWSRNRVMRFLTRNTEAARSILPRGERPSLRDLVRWHHRRKGLWDHLLASALVMPTFGLSALMWKRFMGSCCFAGFIDESSGRMGCLIHPERVGLPDLRRHAFPLIPILGCDRSLICPMLQGKHLDLSLGGIEASQSGFTSLQAGNDP
jgi:hypothetical protein